MGIVNKIKFHAMRAITSAPIRDRIIKSQAGKIGEELILNIENSKFVTAPQVTKSVTRLNSDGFVEFEHKVEANQLVRIVEFTNGLPCYDPFHKEYGRFKLDAVPDATHVANFLRSDLVRNEDIMEIANDPGILKVVSEFLGAKPTISNVNMWWSVAGRAKAEEAQLFHRDVDDWKFCKLFIYLTDVSLNGGPHTYVRGSSHDRRLRKIRRYDDVEIEDVFGADNILQFNRPKGSVFLVDTYGFHKGTLPEDENRLLLQIQYSLNPILIEQYEPVESEYRKAEWNKYINRLVISAE